MTNLVTAGLKYTLGKFLGDNYTHGTDWVPATPIYIKPDFVPTDQNAYLKLNAFEDAGIVIHNIAGDLDQNAPRGMSRLFYVCKITFIRKTGAAWERANKQNIVQQGNTGTPTITATPSVAQNFQKYLRNSTYARLHDGTNNNAVYSALTSMSTVGMTGDFAYLTCDFEATRIESTVIS
jgi:hypothetical protein